MVWEVEGTDEFRAWYVGLSDSDADHVDAAVEELIEKGPNLNRPLSDTLEDKDIPNLKELRPLATNIRILYIFDPRRVAILLCGGDKTNRWRKFYDEMVPRAKRLYQNMSMSCGKKGNSDGGAYEVVRYPKSAT